MKKEELTALGLSEEQAAKVFELNGKDLTKLNNTITTLTTDRDGLKTQLGEANTKLNGYDPEWQTKANEAQRLAEEKVKGLEYQYAAAAVVNGKKFTSEAAKKAFLSDLVEKKLPLDNGKFLGFDDFEKSYKEKDPGAFAGEGAPPRIAASTSGASTPGAQTNQEKANAALREAFGRKGE